MSVAGPGISAPRAQAAPASEAALLDALRCEPERASGWSRLGLFYLDRGAFDAARLCGERAQELDASNPGATLLLAAASPIAARTPAGGREFWDRVLETGTAHPYVFWKLSRVHLAAGEEAQAALRLRDAMLVLPHDLHVRRALRAVLARCSVLYRVLSAPRRGVDWLRGYIASSRFGFLPLIELGYLLTTFVGILNNPFHELRPASLFAAVGFMAIWWPVVAMLEALAGLRLRSRVSPATSADSAREALTSIAAPATALALVGMLGLALLWRPVHEVLPAALFTVFFVVNSALLGGGMLVTEIVRSRRAARYRRRVEEMLAPG